MKTQILHLERHDDINSTRDKMGWGQTPRTLLVWPHGSDILNRRLDLVLIQRHCRFKGSQLAIVTDNPEVRFQAGELGIPVFNSAQDAQENRWRVPRRMRSSNRLNSVAVDEERALPIPRAELQAMKAAAHPEPPAWRQNAWFRLGVFTVGVASILAIASMFVPGAEIHLTPAVETQELEFTVQSSSEIDSISQAGVVPAREISVVVEGRDSLDASGEVELQNTPARGNIRFTNLTDLEVDIPIGTVVRTVGPDPVRFSITEAGTVDEGAGTTLTLPMIALTRGSRGNLPAQSVVAIEGPLGLSLSASNPFPTHGGTNVFSAAPTSRDRRVIYNRLLASLQETAADEIAAALGPGDYLITAEPELIAVHQESYTPDGNVAADQLGLHMQVEFRGLVVPVDLVQLLAGSILDAQLPGGYRVVSQAPEIHNLSEPVIAQDGTASWEVRTERAIVAQIDGGQIAELTMGQIPGEALSRLQDRLALEAPPEIILTPEWWPRLPYLPFRIQVQFADGVSATASSHASPGG
ncbi:MAG: baseplate J/gp47 family protein [Anaerolineales bacterium]|nr:baseplate J/gp47 family protein [Anaerolineales bacterium]